jgi:hypothetical protein
MKVLLTTLGELKMSIDQVPSHPLGHFLILIPLLMFIRLTRCLTIGPSSRILLSQLLTFLILLMPTDVLTAKIDDRCSSVSKKPETRSTQP